MNGASEKGTRDLDFNDPIPALGVDGQWLFKH
jgi:hypothetical protein